MGDAGQRHRHKHINMPQIATSIQPIDAHTRGSFAFSAELSRYHSRSQFRNDLNLNGETAIWAWWVHHLHSHTLSCGNNNFYCGTHTHTPTENQLFDQYKGSCYYCYGAVSLLLCSPAFFSFFFYFIWDDSLGNWIIILIAGFGLPKLWLFYVVCLHVCCLIAGLLASEWVSEGYTIIATYIHNLLLYYCYYCYYCYYYTIPLLFISFHWFYFLGQQSENTKYWISGRVYAPFK